jgi:hypothetical protein
MQDRFEWPTPVGSGIGHRPLTPCISTRNLSIGPSSWKSTGFIELSSEEQGVAYQGAFSLLQGYVN